MMGSGSEKGSDRYGSMLIYHVYVAGFKETTMNCVDLPTIKYVLAPSPPSSPLSPTIVSASHVSLYVPVPGLPMCLR